ncbi:condensin-2 complex subunit H2, putative [Plasmodium vinckei vinckei]|uniref:Condensin-2 complex subunit H2, putative n=1 Tax=Plasmodium vinckei vinckei TaxID=54757 RepID=A0A449BMV3_PLAVN|nr:condensin-2 complex subunit H2, putative [Plasmodium vinckei vinckei]VEV54755.1 condensin-2 complex subunit H2, putative [Plasmodium vinckei vinckei]
MSTQEDEVRLLIQNLQKCNNTNECINFDLASTIQEFLNSLDKNSFEDVDKTIREDENDLMNSFTSAAIFLENCVKIFGLKIEHLHNLAHNTLYNIYKENKNSNSNKKQLLIIDEEEYLYINEIKNLKNTITENDIIEEDLLVKTIPLPTFLFTDHIKVRNKTENHINVIKCDEQDNIPYVDTVGNEYTTSIESKIMDSNSTDSYKNMDSLNLIDNKQTIQMNSVNSLNFDKLFLENDGIILLDINDYNIFINDEYDFTLQNKNSTILFEKYEFFSRNSIYLSNNLSRYIHEQNTIQHTYKINNIYDITSLRLCTDTLLFKTDFYSYDLALDIIKNKNYLINKFEKQKKKLYILDETTHKDHKYNTIYKQNINYCDYCGSIITSITDANDPNPRCVYCNNNEKNGFYKKLPGYYNLSCYNITETEDFLTYMQPNKIIDIIIQNEINEPDKPDEHAENHILNQNDDMADKENNYKLSNDQKLFRQIKIPPLYIQKLGLNIDYYYLEPSIYNLIKKLKKEKNVDRFFSINFYDENEIYDTEILKDEDYQETKDEQNQTIQETLTIDTFINIKSIDNHVNNFPTSILKKTNSNSSLAFDDKIQDRVNTWSNFLDKKLELLKSQPQYNVENYKNKILKYIINNGDNIYLSDLIMNNEKYQMYRNFLTTLMLVNTNKLNITEIDQQNNSNNINNYQVNIKNINVNEYMSFPDNFDTTNFTIKDKKRKITDKLQNIDNSSHLEKKHHT